HIAEGFSAQFVEWLDASGGPRVQFARDGGGLVPGHAYLAPESHHLGLSSDRRIALSDGPPRDGFRPSASHLFESLGSSGMRRMMAVVLSGMGSDGCSGLHAFRAAGGTVIAQDEATSVVFGMPRAVIEAGLADQVLPLPAIAPALMSWTERGDRS